MVVQPRRSSEPGVKEGNVGNHGARPQGSRFDALREVGETFGREDERDSATVEQHHVAKPSFPKKVWTKSKGPKNGNRPVLKYFQ